MEVYVQNNLTNKGKWIELPLHRKTLQKILEEEELVTEEGEYETILLKIWYLPPQPCVQNLFLLNQKVKSFYELTQAMQEAIIKTSLDEGISVEEALFTYL